MLAVTTIHRQAVIRRAFERRGEKIAGSPSHQNFTCCGYGMTCGKSQAQWAAE